MSHCHTDSCHPAGKERFDYMLYGTLGILVLSCLAFIFSVPIPAIFHFSHAVVDILGTVWWGILFGFLAVGLMNKVPRSYFNVLLGRGDTFGGLIRAALAGLLLDLCSHGILMVGAKLYERGASLAQVMTFLIASPWNSITLTLILVALVGLPWTLVFIAGSAVIAILTGFIYMILVKHKILPDNPNTVKNDADFDIIKDAKERLKGFRLTPGFLKDVLHDGWFDGKMVMRWLFLGIIIAALIRAFVSTDMLVAYFGPTLMGLLLTLLATTIIEVCSEGSTPVGAELVTRAGAPGNGFAFLMAGVATDYTEIMVIRQFTKKWLIAFSMPMITVPQIILLGWIMNNVG
ncbi:MAG: ATPase [Alphaproteobacteria bacterium CG_4_9_14_3_um_filter_47_13]|nr:MAG: ATPase [Alphaproteobacteria bacterium CG_4_9_14_3_um_filter_47_13]